MSKRRLKAAELSENKEEKDSANQALLLPEGLRIAGDDSSSSSSEDDALTDSEEESESDSQLEFSDQGKPMHLEVGLLTLRFPLPYDSFQYVHGQN